MSKHRLYHENIGRTVWFDSVGQLRAGYAYPRFDFDQWAGRELNIGDLWDEDDG